MEAYFKYSEVIKINYFIGFFHKKQNSKTCWNGNGNVNAYRIYE